MKAHVVLAHPESNSFNGGLAAISQKKLTDMGYITPYADLYKNNFDPCTCEGTRHYEHVTDNERTRLVEGAPVYSPSISHGHR